MEITPQKTDELKVRPLTEWEKLTREETEVHRMLCEAQEELANIYKMLWRIQHAKDGLVLEMQKLLNAELVLPEPLELTPEMAEEAIDALRAEFFMSTEEATTERGYRIQERLRFAEVEEKLLAEENTEKLKSLYRMFQAGSCPAVFCEENGRFCIGETFKRTLISRNKCMHDRRAQDVVGSANCNGNAVDQAKRMGITLMEGRIAKAHLLPLGVDEHCSDYIQTTAEERARNKVARFTRTATTSTIATLPAEEQYDNLGWRGQLWL